VLRCVKISAKISNADNNIASVQFYRIYRISCNYALFKLAGIKKENVEICLLELAAGDVCYVLTPLEGLLIQIQTLK
jgi:hypothetical protein